MCADMFVGMCVGMCADMRVDIYVDKCSMCVEMCLDIRAEMGRDLYVDICVALCAALRLDVCVAMRVIVAPVIIIRTGMCRYVAWTCGTEGVCRHVCTAVAANFDESLTPTIESSPPPCTRQP